MAGAQAPARVGMPLAEVDTPCLLLELDAFERNLERMARFAERQGLRLRPHAKTHKSVPIAARQIARGAVGICCQKVSEAEAMVHGGVGDVLVSNQVVGPRKVERLAALATQARVSVCVDDAGNVDELVAAARRYRSRIGVLVEIDVGAGRCGVAPGTPAVALARRIATAPGLEFLGLQAYDGAAQHVREYRERESRIERAAAAVKRTVALLQADGLDCAIVSGGGTGSYPFEAASSVYNELQCGSYVFMDADYQRNRKQDGSRFDDFENSLFLYTAIMSKTRPDHAVCDAGLKVQSVDSGLPVVYGRDDVEYVGASDEHGVLRDPDNVLRLGERLRLVPGHCDPTVNVHDHYVVVRDERVVALWPVTARGLCW
jgi:3-hydroxy-D-aspartate aldolase